MYVADHRCPRCNGQVYCEPALLERCWELVCLQCGARTRVPTAADRARERARQSLPPTAER